MKYLCIGGPFHGEHRELCDGVHYCHIPIAPSLMSGTYELVVIGNGPVTYKVSVWSSPEQDWSKYDVTEND